MRPLDAGPEFRTRWGLLAVAGALIALVLTGQAAPSRASHGGGLARDDDRVADYGVCRGTDPSCYHTWDTEFRRDSALRILIYSRTGVSRHAHPGPLPGPALHPPLGPANLARPAPRRRAAGPGVRAARTDVATSLGPP